MTTRQSGLRPWAGVLGNALVLVVLAAVLVPLARADVVPGRAVEVLLVAVLSSLVGSAVALRVLRRRQGPHGG